jgi:hypothetical protein
MGLLWDSHGIRNWISMGFLWIPHGFLVDLQLIPI